MVALFITIIIKWFKQLLKILFWGCSELKKETFRENVLIKIVQNKPILAVVTACLPAG